MADRRLRTVALGITIAILVAASGSAISAASSTAATTVESPTEPAFVVDLQPDGDATVTLVVTYDLQDDGDQQAFDDLRDDSSEVTGAFEQRLSGVATRTADDTGREMAISDVSTTVETTDRLGIIRVSAQWSNLAVVSGDQLTLSEPFASEYHPDRLFVVNAPAGYEITETSHEPVDRTSGSAQWISGTNLSGFSTTLTADGSASTNESLPTPLATVLAMGLLTALGYAGRQRLRRR
jgi:hypothetical protein